MSSILTCNNPGPSIFLLFFNNIVKIIDCDKLLFADFPNRYDGRLLEGEAQSGLDL